MDKVNHFYDDDDQEVVGGRSHMEHKRCHVHFQSKQICFVTLCVLLIVSLYYMYMLNFTGRNPGVLFNAVRFKGTDIIRLHDCSIERDNFPRWYWDASFKSLTAPLEANKPNNDRTLPLRLNITRASNGTNWVQFQGNIRQDSLYDPEDPAVDGLLRDMATLPIVHIEEVKRDTQFKVKVQFSDGGWALLKPTRGNGDRHTAEIAAFHLDRLLGFYRVPPTVGRRVNLTTELAPVLPPCIRETVAKYKDGSTCFDYGVRHVCGRPGVLDVSLMHYLPNRRDQRFLATPTPWRKWSKHGTPPANWKESEEANLCQRTRTEFEAGRPLLLELLDVVYFDMIIDNSDRYEYAYYGYFPNTTNVILYDNGKGFGNASSDFILDQFLYKRGACCLMKTTTFLKLSKLHLTPLLKMSAMLEKSLSRDPLTSVLTVHDLGAVDRRLSAILAYIQECIEDRGMGNVILDDIM